MGRGEGPFCYCAVNHVLRRYIDILSKNYKYVVLDNEAGLEHLSRRTTQDVDVLLVISDATPVALQAAARINRLADELQLRIHKRFLVLNHVSAGVQSERVMDKITQVGLSLVGEIPKDEALLRLSFEGRPLSELSSASPAKVAVKEIVEKILRDGGGS
jgi:CO dehydrogenase maturation factor